MTPRNSIPPALAIFTALAIAWAAPALAADPSTTATEYHEPDTPEKPHLYPPRDEIPQMNRNASPVSPWPGAIRVISSVCRPARARNGFCLMIV